MNVTALHAFLIDRTGDAPKLTHGVLGFASDGRLLWVRELSADGQRIRPLWHRGDGFVRVVEFISGQTMSGDGPIALGTAVKIDNEGRITRLAWRNSCRKWTFEPRPGPFLPDAPGAFGSSEDWKHGTG